MINMLNGSDQTELAFVAVQTHRATFGRLRTIDHDAEEIARQNQSPAGADARLLPFAADVAAARARSRDAAFPRLAARSRPDRTAMANFARAGRNRCDRGDGTRPRRLSAGPEPFPDPARPRGPPPDRAEGGESRSAARPGVDLGQGCETDGDRGAVVGSHLRRHHPALRRAQTKGIAGYAACAGAQPVGVERWR